MYVQIVSIYCYKINNLLDYKSRCLYEPLPSSEGMMNEYNRGCGVCLQAFNKNNYYINIRKYKKKVHKTKVGAAMKANTLELM